MDSEGRPPSAAHSTGVKTTVADHNGSHGMGGDVSREMGEEGKQKADKALPSQYHTRTLSHFFLSLLFRSLFNGG